MPLGTEIHLHRVAHTILCIAKLVLLCSLAVHRELNCRPQVSLSRLASGAWICLYTLYTHKMKICLCKVICCVLPLTQALTSDPACKLRRRTTPIHNPTRPMHGAMFKLATPIPEALYKKHHNRQTNQFSSLGNQWQL